MAASAARALYVDTIRSTLPLHNRTLIQVCCSSVERVYLFEPLILKMVICVRAKSKAALAARIV